MNRPIFHRYGPMPEDFQTAEQRLIFTERKRWRYKPLVLPLIFFALWLVYGIWGWWF